MQKRFILTLILSILVLISIFAYINHSNGKEKSFKILYIASYHPDFSWNADIRQGIIQSFKDKRINIKLKSFYMNTKRQSAPEEIKAKGNEARNIVLKWNPDIIITSDENALIQAALPLRNTKYKFVFCGINGSPEMYNLPSKNITGVLERWHYSDAVRVLKLLEPKIKRIAVLSEQSESSSLIIDQLKANKETIPVEIIGIYQTNSIKEWNNNIKNLQTNCDALMIVLYFSLKDSSGNPVPEQEAIQSLINNSKLPEVGLWPFFANDGGLLAVAVNGFSQGYAAGNMAIEILDGKSPINMKIKSTKDGLIIINEKRAKQLHLIIPPDLIESSKIIWEKECYEKPKA